MRVFVLGCARVFISGFVRVCLYRGVCVLVSGLCACVLVSVVCACVFDGVGLRSFRGLNFVQIAVCRDAVLQPYPGEGS